MRSLVACAAFALLIGCGGANELDPNAPFGPEGSQLECYGDPDIGSIICKPKQDLWDCSTMPNGDWKCAKKSFGPPDGAGGWTCTTNGSTVTCTKPGTGITGGADWKCTDDGKTTTCVYTLTSSPPGGGNWSCSVVEFGLICVGLPPSGGSGLPGSPSSGGSSGGTPPGGSSGGSSGGTPPGGTPPGGSSGGSSGGTGFGCSYAMIVFTYGGKTYVMKIGQDLTCTGDATTSKDANFTATCNGHSYDNNASFTFERDGAPLTPYPGPPPCSALFTITSKSVTAAPGVTILFGVAHNGSFPDHFAQLCPPAGGASSLAFPPICGK